MFCDWQSDSKYITSQSNQDTADSRLAAGFVKLENIYPNR